MLEILPTLNCRLLCLHIHDIKFSAYFPLLFIFDCDYDDDQDRRKEKLKLQISSKAISVHLIHDRSGGVQGVASQPVESVWVGKINYLC